MILLLGPNYVLCLLFIKLSIGFTNAQTVACKSPNVGTVLFSKRDLGRLECWNQDDIALLYSRRLFQDLLPKQVPRNVPIIVEYFKLCLFAMKDVVESEYTFSMMVIAFSDVFGGFLKGYGLPLLNEAYYEGYVRYQNAKKVYDAQNDFVKVLRTNGEQWTPRMEMKKQINKVIPLTITTSTNGQDCSKILTSDKVSNDKNQLQEETSVENLTNSFIPLPLLDDSKEPSTIAVPFKEHSLYNLFHQCSYDILVTYYQTASGCIAELTKDGISLMDQSTFDQMFYTWLKQNVLPHLTDDVWYTGFSNVLRIEATIRKKEGTFGTVQSIHDESSADLLPTVKEESQVYINTTSSLIVIAILVIYLSLVCFLYWAFFKHCLLCCTTIKHENEDLQSSSDSRSSTSQTTRRTTSKTTSFIDDSQNSEERISNYDTRLGSRKHTTVNMCSSMPSLHMVHEKK